MLNKLLTGFAAFALTLAGFVAAAELRQDHPDSYVVQNGDTLWDIARRFLNEPWLWPEIWQANPQIENPHLIYPGDVVSLAYLSGKPALQVTKRSPEVRRERIDSIPTIPLSDIQGFLTKAHILDEDEYKKLPYVMGIEEGRLRAASGQVIYARGTDFQPGSHWAVLRPTVRFALHPHPVTGRPNLEREEYTRAHGLAPRQVGSEWAHYLATDEGFDVLGYELIEIADGQVTRAGDPSILLLGPEGTEVKKGDLLVPYERKPFDLTFHPHAPKNVPENLRVLAQTDRLMYGGTHDVIAISGGSREGIDNGTVFGIYRPGDLVKDDVAHPQPIAASLKKNKVKLPDEFVGHVLVFRTFEKVSYGLIMDSIRPTRLEDKLGAPDHL